ncbi:MAG: hypothetical protein C4519_00960 [Desulfobacteraceae bacterium]|nr:MAG: hypothetical protein C4519_00960 [Desulfobacteraceae bacterium]
MHQPLSLKPSAVLRGYFRAKDENRPHLLAEVFSDDATLCVVNKATNIVFPAVTKGRESIADVLVRRFAQTYENIYSFYLSKPPEKASKFSCEWLVGMTEKESKNVRIGCGRYDWTFSSCSPYLASELVITIETMQVLPSSAFGTVFAWLQRLNYPWANKDEVVNSATGLDLLAAVREKLSSDEPRA